MVGRFECENALTLTINALNAQHDWSLHKMSTMPVSIVVGLEEKTEDRQGVELVK